MMTEKENFFDALRVQGAAAATLDSRQRSLVLFERFLLEVGITDVRAVTGGTLRAYQQALAAHGYAPWTQIVHLQAVRAWFRFLEKTDTVLCNPCEGLLLPRVGSRLPRRVLTKIEARRLLALPDVSTPLGRRDRALLEVFYSTGLRLAEMTALKLQDVDTKNGFIRVSRGKGGKGRIVPVGASACAAVRDYLHLTRRAWSQAVASLDDALWLDSKKPHGSLRKVTLTKTVKKYGRLAGITLSPHVWRHTCATHLVSGGANIAYVQRQLGHRSLRTTQVYTRVTVPDLKQMHSAKHPRARATRAAGPGPADAVASGGVPALPARRGKGAR